MSLKSQTINRIAKEITNLFPSNLPADSVRRETRYLAEQMVERALRQVRRLQVEHEPKEEHDEYDPDPNGLHANP